MSQKAELQRTQRQQALMPDSRHDRVIGVLRAVLPLAIGALAAYLALAPLIQGGEMSFLLDKNEVDVASERMRVTEALYRGEDSQGRPFSIRAGSAVQRSSEVPEVELNDLSARILLDSGPGVLEASNGTYFIDDESVSVFGPVSFESAGGYRLVTRDVDVDLPGRRLASRAPVTGRIPAGTFSANSLRADLSARTVTLEGNARLRMTQGGIR